MKSNAELMTAIRLPTKRIGTDRQSTETVEDEHIVKVGIEVENDFTTSNEMLSEESCLGHYTKYNIASIWRYHFGKNCQVEE